MIDAHLHLGMEIEEDSDKLFNNLDKNEMYKILLNLSGTIFRNKFKKGLIYILDDKWLEHDYLSTNIPDSIIVGVLVDPLSKNIEKQLDKLLKQNIKFLKILPYEQEIFKNNYSKVLELAKKVEERKMVLTVCCAYGSRHVYKTNGVELVSYLVNNGIESPIIMAHGGMTRVFDAMALMLEFPNLYMDISFTFSYWWGSRILDDYAFVFDKLSYNRIFYGSDFPYVSFADSLSYFRQFCSKYNINEKSKNKILYKNFQKLLTKV